MDDYTLRTQRIAEDHDSFRQVFGGKIRKELQKYINNGSIFRNRGKNGKISITIPRIDIPRFVFGDSDQGVGRGPGKEGDVIDKDGKDGKKGGKAGQEHADGVTIAIDLEDVFKFMQDELKLPDLKPKPCPVFEEVEIKYNDISLQGPESLRHNRRTMLQAMRRMAAAGTLDDLHQPPGFADPIRIITPINSDRRYRQYKEIRKPASNAVIFFARDGSGSMDEYKCNIVSDMAWWMDLWIRRYYKKVETCYVWHDTAAELVDQEKFYNYRYGGGTTCSSALKRISSFCTKKEHRYPPDKWNIFIFYFGDGENYGKDNQIFNEVIRDRFPPAVVNMIAVTQVCSWFYQSSLLEAVKEFPHADNVRTASIGGTEVANKAQMYYGHNPMTEEQRDAQIKQAIIDILGANSKPQKANPENAVKAVA